MDSKMVREEFRHVPIVNEFSNVILEKLPRILPNKNVKFFIDVTSGIALTSSVPYRMAPYCWIRDLSNQVFHLGMHQYCLLRRMRPFICVLTIGS